MRKPAAVTTESNSYEDAMRTMTKRILLWLWRRRYALAVGGALIVAIALRLALVLAGWPGTDSDDATMGLMARHIQSHGEFPIFFWGQAYMGALEAYVAAFFFALFGASVATLKLSLILLYALFLLVMYFLLKLLFSQRWALVGLVFLSLSSPAVLYLLLNAYGGYLETLLFGALLILVTCHLLRAGSPPGRPRLRRWLLFAAWGLVAGLGIYSDLLIAPFVLFTGLALILLVRRDLLSRAGLLLCLCFLLGVSPWIIYVATTSSPDAAKSFLQHQPSSRQTAIPGTSAAAPPSLTTAVEAHLLGAVVVAIPNMTSGMNLCPLAEQDAWPPTHWSEQPSVQPCVAIRGVWGAGVLVLLLLVVAWESVRLRRLMRVTLAKWSGEERARAVRAAGRLLAVAAPLLTVALFMASSASATSPWIYARYLVTLLIAFPVLLASVGERITMRLPADGARARSLRRAGIIAALALVIVLQAPGVVATVGAVQAQQKVNAQQMDLVQRLIARGDRAVYTEFWTCYRTAFLSDEQVVCSVVASDYTPKPNRYPPWDKTVRAAKAPAFVFPLHSPQARNFPALARQQGWRYGTISVDDQWVIFEVTQ